MIRNLTRNQVHVQEDIEGQLYLISDDGQVFCLPEPEQIASILEGKSRKAETHTHELEVPITDAVVRRTFEHTHEYTDPNHVHKKMNIPPERLKGVR